MNPIPMRILIPLDGSPQSEVALAAVMPLARNQPVRITLLRAVEMPDDVTAAHDYLARAREALALHRVEADAWVRVGDPAEAILAAGEDGSFDLLAMSTHGRSGLSRLVMGSVAEGVIRRTPIPVIACRPDSKVGNWKKIVVALDGSVEAEQSISDAVHLAKLMEGTLYLVQVAQPVLGANVAIEGYVYLPPQDPMPYLRSIQDRLENEAVVVEVVGLVGPPGKGIVDFAREIEAGLVCLTTHGRTGLERALLGSTTESVLRHAPCPVLVRRVVRVAATT